MSHVTLRLLKPECALDQSWCQEELPVAVRRAVSLLHTHTIPSRVGKGEPGKGPGTRGSLSFLHLWSWESLLSICPLPASPNPLGFPHLLLSSATFWSRASLWLRSRTSLAPGYHHGPQHCAWCGRLLASPTALGLLGRPSLSAVLLDSQMLHRCLHRPSP